MDMLKDKNWLDLPGDRLRYQSNGSCCSSTNRVDIVTEGDKKKVIAKCQHATKVALTAKADLGSVNLTVSTADLERSAMPKADIKLPDYMKVGESFTVPIGGTDLLARALRVVRDNCSSCLWQVGCP